MKRASYGHAAMHALHPLHASWWTSTTPPLSWMWLAPHGQQGTHGGSSQWLQRSLRISMWSDGEMPAVSYTIQSRLYPSGTPFSVLHATTQSMQPTHFAVSITIP
jgi:hypothetical protein